jgi:peptidoglycan/xylan/chitin deacetylase (PgdA/CDA1 family)
VVAIALAVGAGWSGSIAAWIALGGWLVVFGWGVAKPQWSFFGPVVVDCGDPGSVALTFDDGPDPALTPLVLDWLSRHGFRATFFLVGEKVLRHPDLARRIVAEGHLVASHSHDHSVVSNFRLTVALTRDLAQVRAAFREVLGLDPALHRPPVGLTNPHLFRALAAHGMVCVAWNRAGGEAANRRIAGIRAIGDLARPGAIVLLHDVLPRPEHRELFLEQLELLARGIGRQGLGTTTLDRVEGLVAWQPVRG